MKLIRFFVLLFMLSNSNNILATAQAPDYLISGKDTLKMQCNPLESYFKEKPIPKGLITSMSTALWRGYIAYFKITNNKLIVENIYKVEYSNEDGNREKLISIYKDIFGNQENFECNFYSGVLICPLGEIVEYVHMGYSSIYEKYKLIEIKDGNFQKEKELNYNEFMELKVAHFKRFKQTDEYKKQFDELMEATKQMDKDMEKMLGEFSKDDKKKKKKNKYLYEKEKEIEAIKTTENFLFLFLTNNIKTIDLN